MTRGDFSVVVALVMTLLPRPSLTLGVTLRAQTEESPTALSEAILQLTQRFATLEVSLESRLSRLTDTAAKGEALISSLSSRLDKVDALVEMVDALDERLTQETASLRFTIATTNRDVQGMSMRLERMDRMAETTAALHSLNDEMEGQAEGEEEGSANRHGIRSSWDSSASDIANLSEMITRSVAVEVERTLPLLLDRSLSTFQHSLYKRLSKNVAQLQEEVREARQELEHIGTQTLTTATGARQDIRQGGKTTQDAVTDIKNKIQSVHRDLAFKITSSPSLRNLEPVLRLMNHSVVESIARATAGLNVTLLDGAARRRGTSDGQGDEGRDQPALHCPDPTTVTTLLEVKHLLESLLRKSEDLRRGLTKQNSEGIDLLKILNQRFSFLIRRINTVNPDYGQRLTAQMQDLNNLVESSYMAVMMAQSVFIDSCKRIQEEEPLLEQKMTELLDKLVTNVDLGYQHNRQQLSELKEVVKRLGQNGVNTNATQNARTRAESIMTALGDAASVPGLVQDVILDAVEAANYTVSRLEEVEVFVDDVTTNLLNMEWTEHRQKDAADQLVTAAKDLKGYAQEQIIQSLDLYSELLDVIEQFNSSMTRSLNEGQGAMPVSTTTLEMLGDAAPLTLPPTCTAALLQQVRNLQGSQASAQSHAPHHPLADAASGHREQQGQEEGREGRGEEGEEEEDVPAWYTDPVFLSGNYGTPDRGLPVFREEDWMDMEDVYDTEPAAPTITTTLTPTTPRTPSTVQHRPATGDVDRYFGMA